MKKNVEDDGDEEYLYEYVYIQQLEVFWRVSIQLPNYVLNIRNCNHRVAIEVRVNLFV